MYTMTSKKFMQYLVNEDLNILANLNHRAKADIFNDHYY